MASLKLKSSSRNRNGLGWAASDFFVLRTPFLPLDALLSLSDSLEATMHCSDPALLEASLCRDRLRVRDRLRILCERADVREALFIASPSLEERLAEWQRDPETERGQKLERSLLCYLS